MSKLLVTGAAGFIGSNFIYYQLAHHPEDEILCLDKLTYAGNIATLKPALSHHNIRFIRGDIADWETVFSIFHDFQPETVVNFAAETHVDRFIKDPGVFVQTNVVGTQTLMDASLKYGVKRYHQVSTDEVYGDLPLDRKDLLFTEDTPLHTSSPYSAAKASADLLAQAYHRTFQLPLTISRCSNNYGGYQFLEKLIPRMIAAALADQPLPVYGNGANVRDWLYVEDHCAAIDAIIRRGQVGEVYNIGGNNEHTNLEVVKTILREVGKPESLIHFVTDRPGHDLRYAINPAKIHRELGWLPQTQFDAGIRSTIRWYLDNEDWWAGILSGAYAAENEKFSL